MDAASNRAWRPSCALAIAFSCASSSGWLVDVATHFLVPYAGALAALGLARRGVMADPGRLALAVAFGLGGAAPDLDGLLDPLSEWDSAWFALQHRGASHSLVGAPVLALVVVGALAVASRWWPSRLSAFAWRPAIGVAAALGSLSHLALDAVTFGGVPLAWPFVDGRVTLGIFGWLVWWLFPVGVVVIALHAWGRLGPRRVVVAGALVVAALVVVAGVRLAERPWPGDGALVFPTDRDLVWMVATPAANGSWLVESSRLGARSDPAWFEPSTPPGAEGAFAIVRDSDAYRGFLLGAFGPVVERAERRADGGWNVSFVDVAQRYYATHAPSWTTTDPHDAWGLLALVVREDRVTAVTHRGW